MTISRLGLAYGSLVIAIGMLMVHLDAPDFIALPVAIGMAAIALTHMRKTSRCSRGNAS